MHSNVLSLLYWLALYDLLLGVFLYFDESHFLSDVLVMLKFCFVDVVNPILFFLG